MDFVQPVNPWRRVKIVFLSFLILYLQPGYSQIVAKPLKDIYVVRPDSIVAPHSFTHPISSVHVVDMRQDKESLGYYSEWKENGKYVLPGAIETIFDEWISRYLNIREGTGTGGQLFIFIKKLRISESATAVIFDNGHQGQPQNGWEKGVVLKAEFFLNRDSVFYPLYRYDSVIVMDEKLPKYANSYLDTALVNSLSRLFSFDWSAVSEKSRKLKLVDIKNRYQQDNDWPILTSAVLKKGVYMNFDEFRTNNPSIAEYSLKKSRMGDMLFVKDKEGTELPERKCWGYCDGRYCFINSGDKYSRLVPEGNTFYFLGSKSPTMKTYSYYDTPLPLNINSANAISLDRISDSHFEHSIRNYQLDMETGKVY